MSVEKANQNLIHPSAIIAQGAKIAADVKIGPFCVIGPDVELDGGVELKSHVVIEGHTRIGSGTIVFPFASLGAAPQDLKYKGEPTRLEIGARNVIREYVTINPGTIDDEGLTRIGDDCLLMIGAHVAHDCRVGNKVILANNATLAGHVHVGDHVILGGLSAVHQFVRIGEHAIIGGMSGVEADVIPYGRVKGERAHLAGLNLIGLNRMNISKNDIKALTSLLKALFDQDGSQTLQQRLDQARKDFSGNAMAMQVLDFAAVESKFPLCHPPAKK